MLKKNICIRNLYMNPHMGFDLVLMNLTDANSVLKWKALQQTSQSM